MVKKVKIISFQFRIPQSGMKSKQKIFTKKVWYEVWKSLFKKTTLYNTVIQYFTRLYF